MLKVHCLWALWSCLCYVLAAHTSHYTESLSFFLCLSHWKKAVCCSLPRSSICLHCFTSMSQESSDSDLDANLNRLWTVTRKKYICMLYVLIRIRIRIFSSSSYILSWCCYCCCCGCAAIDRWCCCYLLLLFQLLIFCSLLSVFPKYDYFVGGSLCLYCCIQTKNRNEPSEFTAKTRQNRM